MADTAPAFDPNAPFEEVGAAPPFDPNAPYEEVKTAEDRRASTHKAQPIPPGVSDLESIEHGAGNVFHGGAQLVDQLTPSPIRNSLNQFQNWLSEKTGGMIQKIPEGGFSQLVREREEKYQKKRGPTQAPDIGSFIGESIPMLALGAVATPEAAAARVGPWGLRATNGLLEAAKRISSSALVGGVSAGAQPVLSRDDEFWNKKLEQMGTGAVLGGILGVGAEGVTKAVQGVAAHLARNNPDLLTDQAVQTILRRWDQDVKGGGATMVDALDLVQAANRKGIPLTLADLGERNIENLAGGVYRQPGAARTMMSQFIKNRDKGALDRLDASINQNLHGGDTMHQTYKLLQSSRSAEARPAYAKLETLENIWSPRLQEFLDNPNVAEGLKRGMALERDLALAEGREFNPMKLGVDLDQEGNIRFVKVPNMYVLSVAKEGLDDMVAAERDSITGQISKKGFALDRLRSAYLKELDKLDTNGVYRAARDAWAGPSASMDAVKVGRTIFMQRPEEFAEYMAKLSPANQDFVRVGAADIMRERIAKANFNGDEAKAIMNNEWTKRVLRPLFKSNQQFEDFVNSVSMETKMFDKGVAITRGSQTAERGVEDRAGQAFDMASKLWMHDVFTNARNLFQMYRDLGLQRNPQLDEKIAQILFQSPITPQIERQLKGQVVPASTRRQELGNRLRQALPSPAAPSGVAAGQVLGGEVSPDQNGPSIKDARQAQDGNFYVPDPNRPGKYLQVVQ